MTSHSWETLSNQATAAAAIIYFLALLATLVEWSALLGRTEEKEAERVPVGAAAGLEASSSGGSTYAATDGPETPSSGGSGTTDGPGSTAAEREQRVAMFGRLGYLLAVIATLCHVVAVVTRGLAADRVPWGNMFEFTLTGTCIVAVAYVILSPRLKLAWLAPMVIGFVLVFLMVAVVVLYTPVEPLREALHSYWLVIHVVAAALASGAFSLGGMCSVFYLVKARKPNTTTGWLSRVPALDVLDRVSYRIHAFAFPVWTFAVLIAGPIWAHQAWGSYWNWDPKEVWAFITWVVYAGYLHARATAGWRGRRAAILALVGMGTLWFNFIGINYFSTTSMHSYAGGAPSSLVQVVAPR